MTQYPLRENASEDLRAFSGRPLSEVTAEAIASGNLSADDLRPHAHALRQQAQVAADAGYPQLASNFRRAAELTCVPNDELLKIYELLRPERATYEELEGLADYLEANYDAKENAVFIREAAAVYRQRKLLRR